jgi:hypothetical protein
MAYIAKKTIRYTFGLDDPFLGSMDLEEHQVAPVSSHPMSSHSASYSDPADYIPLARSSSDKPIKRLSGNTKRPPQDKKKPTTHTTSAALRRSLSLQTILSSPVAPRRHAERFTITKREPVFAHTESTYNSHTSPFRKEDENPFICENSWQFLERREVKRPRILIETLSENVDDRFYQYGNRILTDLIESERNEPFESSRGSYPSLNWLDEKILETEKILHFNDKCDMAKEDIEFSTSFINAFIEDLDKVFSK